MIIRLFVVVFLLLISSSTQLKDENNGYQQEHFNLFNKQKVDTSHGLPTYSIYLDQPAHQRFKQVIEDKKELLNKFIDYLYGLDKFKYSMWIAKAFFNIFPDFLIKRYLGKDFYEQCSGIAQYSGRKVYEIVIYNYMYEIGAAHDFCTSIALTQVDEKLPSQNNQKQNLKILARNLDYGFQQFLGENTIRFDFYKDSKSTSPLYTLLSHAGFVSSHTVLKYESDKDLQFGISLNQRKSGSYIETVKRIIFQGCQSVFQLTNRILKSQISTTQQLIQMVSQSKSCSQFYFIIQIKTGENVLIEKNYGVGVHQVYIKNQTNILKGENPSYILQTNTDINKPDPDGRRDEAVHKINNVVQQKGFITQKDIEKVLLQSPNFNKLTIMTALIDVQRGSIKAVVWQNSQNSNSIKFSNQIK